MELKGRPVVFLDNPGGTQTPREVIEAVRSYYLEMNANQGGSFKTSQDTDAMVEEARRALADMLNAASPGEIVLGANMTTLTMHMSRCLARELNPGDEVVVTRLDHDANISPWLLVAEDRGAVVRWVDFDPSDCTIDMRAFAQAITERTKLVAVGYASNATGTITDIEGVVKLAHGAGALVYVDAVAFAPHRSIDVQQLNCDFLVCSAYKFYGPHVGILYGKTEHLERISACKLRPAPATPPGKFETGTLNLEGIAGTLAAVNYLAGIGQRYGRAHEPRHQGFAGRRMRLRTAFDVITEHEQELVAAMIEAVAGHQGVRIYGITDPNRFVERVPTVSFTWGERPPADLAAALGREGMFAWSGNYYALATMDFLGLEQSGGMVRVGAAHYNTLQEIERLHDGLGRAGRAVRG